jgi:hypothetical protein
MSIVSLNHCSIVAKNITAVEYNVLPGGAGNNSVPPFSLLSTVKDI